MDKAARLTKIQCMDPIVPPRLPPAGRHWMTVPRLGRLAGAGAVLAAVAVTVAFGRRDMPESVALLLCLSGVLVSAAAFGFWTGILAALGAFGVFNFLFVEPHFSFLAARPQDLVTLGAFLLAAALTGLLAGRLREQVDAAEGRAAVLEILSQATADLSAADTVDDILRAALRHVSALSPGPVLAFARDGGDLRLISALPEDFRVSASDLQAVDQTFSRGRVEFPAFEGWSGSRFTFHPMPPGKAAGHVLGHLPVATERRDRMWRDRAIPMVLRLAESALDRIALRQRAEAERRSAESQALRAALLASLSHDLRTPLATILGSVTTLRDLRQTLPAEAQEDLLIAVEEEAERLARYVEKLLQMTRLMAGVTPEVHLVDASEVAQAARARAQRAFAGARIAFVSNDLPLVRVEAGLLEQAIFGLLENALRYAPGEVRMVLRPEGDTVVIDVVDQGPGLPAAIADWLAGPALTGGPEGTGLGLPICKGIARTLGGRLVAAPSPGGGTILRLILPVAGEAA